MEGFVIWVVFWLKPGKYQEFVDSVRANAASSVRDEPGCRQFDVLIPHDGTQDRVALYEIYEDERAFEAHLQTEHYKAFDQTTAPMIRDKRVEQYDLTNAR